MEHNTAEAAETLDALELLHDQVEGFQREVVRLRRELEQARQEAVQAKKERDQAIEHDVAMSRMLGRTEALLDEAKVRKTDPAPGTPGLVQVRNLFVYERVELALAELRATSGALDQVESERAEAVVKAMAAEDLTKRIEERCKRLEWWALQLVGRMPWRFVS